MRDYKKYFKLNASPEDVYNVLVNPVMLEIWTGEPAVMSEEPNSEFSLWDGAIVGKNLEFEKNRKIVQEWYFGEDTPSIVTFMLHPDKSRTSLEIRHTNIPDDAYDNIVDGWEEDYMGSVQSLFEI
ncbi:ATPase [Prolixibacteraceae bacterium JC049]|nr:ATPase [Prolixibacteraceae bacterium JC049]